MRAICSSGPAPWDKYNTNHMKNADLFSSNCNNNPVNCNGIRLGARLEYVLILLLQLQKYQFESGFIKNPNRWCNITLCYPGYRWGNSGHSYNWDKYVSDNSRPEIMR